MMTRVHVELLRFLLCQIRLFRSIPTLLASYYQSFGDYRNIMAITRSNASILDYTVKPVIHCFFTP